VCYYTKLVFDAFVISQMSHFRRESLCSLTPALLAGKDEIFLPEKTPWRLPEVGTKDNRGYIFYSEYRSDIDGLSYLGLARLLIYDWFVYIFNLCQRKPAIFLGF
jgi:hypothetical protein